MDLNLLVKILRDSNQLQPQDVGRISRFFMENKEAIGLVSVFYDEKNIDDFILMVKTFAEPVQNNNNYNSNNTSTAATGSFIGNIQNINFSNQDLRSSTTTPSSSNSATYLSSSTTLPSSSTDTATSTSTSTSTSTWAM